MAKDKGGNSGGTRPDIATLGGLLLAVGGILTGLMMEGGKIRDVAQITAAMIVLGGTIGAVMVTTPLAVLLRAAKKMGLLFFDRSKPLAGEIDSIINYAAQARKQGIVSLEQQAATVADPFLRKALNLAVDGIELSQIRGMMELEITLVEQDGEAEAKVFEAAGGYAPTIGIIGAVLGLIQVMKNLANIDEVGRGIAVAFVATVYGVGSANLFFLPAASKLRARVKEEVRRRELMLDGVLSIVEGLNPKLISTKLEAYAQARDSQAKAGAKAQMAGQPAAAEG
ncbi:MAG TPA: flagellar motor protein [Bryobacteraceae bacterium]|nr:flagellar motor protein [Bryobacteraceae bacterium]